MGGGLILVNSVLWSGVGINRIILKEHPIVLSAAVLLYQKLQPFKLVVKTELSSQ